MKCFKCGKSEGKIIKHHTNYNPEVIVDCCMSCHTKIHNKVRKEGKCRYSPQEVVVLSTKSSKLRNNKVIALCDSVCPGVRLHEQIRVNINTGNIYYGAYFQANKGKELLFVDIDDASTGSIQIQQRL